MNEDRYESEHESGGTFVATVLYPLTVLLCAAALTLAGLVLGYARSPTYTSSAEVLVGNLSVSDPAAVPGAVGASNALAEVYSRLISADEVRKKIANETGSGDEIPGISATPVVNTPLIRVTATSDSEEGAIAAANAAAKALSDYIVNRKTPGSDVGPIARRYQAAALEYATQEDALDRLRDRVGDPPTPSERLQLNEASAALDTARLKRDALGGLYERGQDIEVSQPSLEVFESAESATSDRSSTMQITGGIGLIAGLALGAAIALIRASRRARQVS